MVKRILVLQVPVIHEGYLDLFDTYQNQIDKIFILTSELVNKITGIKPDIASVKTTRVKELLNKMGYKNVQVLNLSGLKKLHNSHLFLINDQVGRKLQRKYFANTDVEFINVFLRWDREKVFSDEGFTGKTSNKSFDQKMMKLAYEQAQNSGDWWRQVGLVLVKNRKIIAKSYNQSLPHEHSPYQTGAVRDLMNVGELPEKASYLHAEQALIAKAARDGVPLKGTKMYVTHFPCPVCAKLLACTQLRTIYFAEGSSNLRGQEILESRSVGLVKVMLD